MTARSFGSFIRRRRESLRGKRAGYSLRAVAKAIEVQPSYLSKVERGLDGPPSERTILRLARVLDVDPDVLLAMAGKVSSELQAIIRRRPELMSELLHELKDLPEDAVLRIVRDVRDGTW